jgi:hypothetical protein
VNSHLPWQADFPNKASYAPAMTRREKEEKTEMTGQIVELLAVALSFDF